MERRDFLKLSAIGGATAALEGCGNPDHQLIRFVPEEDLVPGIATWKPSICTLCPAGCGLIVRVMQGEAEVVRNGQLPDKACKCSASAWRCRDQVLFRHKADELVIGIAAAFESGSRSTDGRKFQKWYVPSFPFSRRPQVSGRS